MRTKNFTGKVVVITGSSKGIGRESARAFARAGAHVVLNGRDEKRLTALRDELTGEGLSAGAFAADVTNAEEAKALVEHASSLTGVIDVIVNNAGLSMRGPFEETSPEVIEAVTRVNILGAALPTRYAIPYLKKSGGSVVFVSSLAGIRGFPGVAVYSSAKMALTAFSQALRAELRGSGVHVGLIWVSFTENDPDKQIYSAAGEPIRIERSWKTTQREVATAILRLVVRRRNELAMTAQGKLFVLLNRLCPRLVRMIIHRSGGAVHRYRK